MQTIWFDSVTKTELKLIRHGGYFSLRPNTVTLLCTKGRVVTNFSAHSQLRIQSQLTNQN